MYTLVGSCKSLDFYWLDNVLIFIEVWQIKKRKKKKKKTWLSLLSSHLLFLFSFVLSFQTSFSLQECLRLLEETFPFAEEQQVRTVLISWLESIPPLAFRRTQHFYSFLVPRLQDVGDRGGEPEHQSETIFPTRDSSWDLELHWQDLLAIMEPQVHERIE